MWKAAVFVCLLLNMTMEVNGATGNVTAGNSRPENEVKSAEIKNGTTGTTPARDSDSSVFMGKLLVVPQDGSHWVGLKAIAQEMGRRGHQVTIVMPEISMRMGPGKHYSTLTFPVPYDKTLIDSMLNSHTEVMCKSAQPFMEKISRRFSQFQNITGFLHSTAESLLFNASLISHLSQQVNYTKCSQ